MKLERKKIFSLSFLLFLLLVLAFSLDLVSQTQYYLSEALGKRAKITVNTAVNLGPVVPFWQNLAQGGEEKNNMLQPVFSSLSDLQPKYIRLDHLYDYYDVIDRIDGRLTFNWQKLDEVVDTILATGAKPFFSLSYMPSIIAQDGKITNPPQSWIEWEEVVLKTIEHFSGQKEKNLTEVYYEVWNEPDLFGDWRLGGGKDYRLLYGHAARAAQRAKGVNSFKIGGPATTGLYRNWVDSFLNYVSEKKLRLDFYSWHRYSPKPEDFLKDINLLDRWLTRHGGYALLPKVISEWGSDPENSPFHDQAFDAAHLVAAVRQMWPRIEKIFTFEIKDGPDPNGKEFWGRWGLLTYLGRPKPKYQAFILLNQIKGDILLLEGEGTWVTGIAAKEKEALYLLLCNLDQSERHFENVPVIFRSLKAESYQIEKISLNQTRSIFNQKTAQGELFLNLLMSPNEVIFLKLTPKFPAPK